MVYASYEFYRDEYHGLLPEATALAMLARADFVLDRLTFGRLRTRDWVSDASLARCVRMAACALADDLAAQDKEDQGGGMVTSESVGKWSQSRQQRDQTPEAWERKFRRTAAAYIPVETNLLYTGVGGGGGC